MLKIVWTSARSQGLISKTFLFCKPIIFSLGLYRNIYLLAASDRYGFSFNCLHWRISWARSPKKGRPVLNLKQLPKMVVRCGDDGEDEERYEQLEVFICCSPACTPNYTCCLLFRTFSQQYQLSDQLWASVKSLALAAVWARQANTFLVPTFRLSGMDLFQPSDIYHSLFFGCSGGDLSRLLGEMHGTPWTGQRFLDVYVNIQEWLVTWMSLDQVTKPRHC